MAYPLDPRTQATTWMRQRALVRPIRPPQRPVGKRVTPVIAAGRATNDPYAPLSEDEIGRRVRERVQASTDPILQEINRSINAQTQRGAASIRGFTESQARELAGAQGVAAGIYERGGARLGAVNTALADRLGGQGAQVAGDLSARTAAINAPTATTQAATGLAAMGTGAANAGFASGSADISAMAVRGAEEENLAAQYPTLARMVGAQGIKALERDALAQIADRTGEVTSQIPGAISEMEEDYRDEELAKATARDERSRDTRDFAENRRQFEATLAENRKIREATFQQDTKEALIRESGDALDRAAREAEKEASRAATAAEKAKDRAARATEGDKNRASREAIEAAKTARDARKAAKTARDKATKARGSAGKQRANAVSKARTTATKRARELYKGEKAPGGKLTPGGAVTRKTYSQAFAAVYAEIAPELQQRYAITPTRIRQIVNEALHAAGFAQVQRRSGV